MRYSPPLALAPHFLKGLDTTTCLFNIHREVIYSTSASASQMILPTELEKRISKSNFVQLVFR